MNMQSGTLEFTQNQVDTMVILFVLFRLVRSPDKRTNFDLSLVFLLTTFH